MIYKEEKILFPTALTLLNEQDWYEIYQQSDDYGYCLYAPEFAWAPDGTLPMDQQKDTLHSGRVQMPTGSFKLEEMIAMFQTLPFDMTFVDKDDTVRYFSPGRNRIFDRSRAILGRKVQYCHPPKSVHIVNKIVKDFKAGKEDAARFWINMQGKLIYIVYYAIRNDAGEGAASFADPDYGRGYSDGYCPVSQAQRCCAEDLVQECHVYDCHLQNY